MVSLEDSDESSGDPEMGYHDDNHHDQARSLEVESSAWEMGMAILMWNSQVRHAVHLSASAAFALFVLTEAITLPP